MRWTILRTLLHKEALRHLANRGGLTLFALLIVAAMLLSFFGGKEGPGGLTAAVRVCFLDYHADTPFVRHLRQHVPADLLPYVHFRHISQALTTHDGTIVYPHNAAAIQLRPTSDNSPTGFKVWFWHPGTDPAGLAPFEIWFWKEAHHFLQEQHAILLHQTSSTSSIDPELGLTGPVEDERSSLAGGYDTRSGIATSLVLFGLFFVCVYLLPSLTCEERERGVLLAQALSPASTLELLAAKFLFYPVFGLILAAILAGTYRPAVLVSPFFWVALIVSVVGSMGIGLTIASVARTQRAASMGALCYMLVVALLLFICQQNGIPGLPLLALEYHSPRMLHAALTGSVLWYHYLHLLGAASLAILWAAVAAVIFRRHGWQ
jgi:hypothetical protein